MARSGHDRIERQLAAILAADVAGYSRLTGVDEEGTHVQLQAHLRALIDPKVAEHRGRDGVGHVGQLRIANQHGIQTFGDRD